MVRVLAPYLGETMARGAVHSQKDRLRLDERELTREQLESLLENLGPGLVVFVGRDKTERILDEVRAAIEPLIEPSLKGER